VTHVLVALVAFALSCMLTPVVRRLAPAIGATDQPDGRKIHAEATPRLGGVAVMASAVVALVLVPGAFEVFTGATPDLGDRRGWIALAGGGALVFGVGLWDDIRRLPASAKLLVHIAAAGVVVSQGIVMHRFTVMGTTVELGWLSVPLTIVWLVGITNAFNLIDGLDGLATGLAIIASVTAVTLFIARGNAPGALPLVAMLGAAVGFLPYNFFPASIFLGDAGSLSFGFVLAVTSVTGWQKSATAIAIGAPLLVLALPILDTAASVARRLPDGGRVFVADRRHLHHRLLAYGLSPRTAVLFLYAVALLGSLIALATSRLE
jgi:UDP-GlcNAc:undecaprenyl-phosphate/decaprenyl-phosphate GlcNAc-1-phosphate transferase